MWATDGNGDKIGDPNNIWDASLSAAWYLCASGKDLRDPKALKKRDPQLQRVDELLQARVRLDDGLPHGHDRDPRLEGRDGRPREGREQAAAKAAEAAARAAAVQKAQAAAKQAASAAPAQEAPASPALIAPMPGQPAPAAPAQPSPVGKDAKSAPAGPPATGSAPAAGDIAPKPAPPRTDERTPEKPKDGGKAVDDALSGLAKPPKSPGGIGEPRP